jgi:class 3 adenylate cyclase
VTGVARPGSVLCTESVRDQAPDRFDWSFARRHKLKGMSEPIPLYRARPLNAGDEPPASADEESPKKRPKAGRRRTRASS